jgi:hypothetical protein
MIKEKAAGMQSFSFEHVETRKVCQNKQMFL